MLVWNESVFSHGSGVCHIVHGVGVVIEELCPSPILILCVVLFGTYLDDDEDIRIWWNLHNVLFCKSEFNGFVFNKVF